MIYQPLSGVLSDFGSAFTTSKHALALKLLCILRALKMVDVLAYAD